MTQHRELFFVFRLGIPGQAPDGAEAKENSVEAKAIDCGVEADNHLWSVDFVNGYTLPSGPAVQVRQVCVEYISTCRVEVVGVNESHSDSTVVDIHEKESFLDGVDGMTAVCLLAAQHVQYVFIDTTLALPQLPSFISNDALSIPKAYHVRCKMLTDNVVSNPDVVAYFDRISTAPIHDHFDIILSTPPAKPIPYPRECWMPGTFESADGRKTACVYQLTCNESLQLFLVDDSIDVSQGGTLARSARLSSGDVFTRSIAVIDATVNELAR